MSLIQSKSLPQIKDSDENDINNNNKRLIDIMDDNKDRNSDSDTFNNNNNKRPNIEQRVSIKIDVGNNKKFTESNDYVYRKKKNSSSFILQRDSQEAIITDSEIKTLIKNKINSMNIENNNDYHE